MIKLQGNTELLLKPCFQILSRSIVTYMAALDNFMLVEEQKCCLQPKYADHANNFYFLENWRIVFV